MDELILDILKQLRDGSQGALDTHQLEMLINSHNSGIDSSAHSTEREKLIPKRAILPYFLQVKQNNDELWQSWNVTPELEERFIRSVRMKPRRTASGVATITVITRPHTCSSNCIYCPCDLRMPKSYLANEPACQRAELTFFDPYVQVAARLQALHQMGHSTDKVELIVLGGTWSDYPESYQYWFIKELFRALNEWPNSPSHIQERLNWYTSFGLQNSEEALSSFVAEQQAAVFDDTATYNQAFHKLYDTSQPHQNAWSQMQSTYDELVEQQHVNETAAARVVGLVIETRPDTITPDNLRMFRQLGCTKIQIGIQSTRQEILDANQRQMNVAQIKRAFSLIRLYGFKIHSHLMVNLLGATPEADKRDFKTFVTDPGFLPDEIKLYPCALVSGTQLVQKYREGAWQPYAKDELVDVLVQDVLATPPYVRISRMIRDISATDILVGNKHTNLRQMVEQELAAKDVASRVQEIRFREINQQQVRASELTLQDFTYTTAVSDEHFLQWVTADNKIAGFCRLSLPHWDKLTAGACDVTANELLVQPGQAMIRELHVYGQALSLGSEGMSAQHQGLGQKLLAKASSIAADVGYTSLNVISSIGTRAYYRAQGFTDAGFYQQKAL
ncbi:histone acetyltransferase, ELP3 family [Atopobium sp. ICM42b]|uniref:elongator complex protein 3 n=1 Tax=Atopobium sp. ICM42b TaxID=1190620 RepID=UPI00044EC200|nr:tRNA uridine(34) 5-carboxymethylaminomethyl modification radical SAM/GNAT enzyme Elp3 [Atopobium sp. ICM42b]EWC94149.1 histone acetyltransferase, ELP3 family [Atopobium sp. ICM42b]